MRLLLLLFVQLSCYLMLSAQAEKRLALLIGNGNYAEAPLKNPAKDAQALGSILEKLGFETSIRTHRNLSAMKRDINQFRDQVQKAKQSGYRTIACVYYSGHGMQIGGTNYLIPIAHQIEDQVDVEREAYPADVLLKKLQLATADVNIVILDACRNNPFERSLKGRVKDLFPELEEGLADIGTPTVGTLIAYATAPGKVANDGDENNSPYAKALIKYLPQAGITIEQVFRRVRNEVYASTRKTQTPWEASSLMGDDLYLKALPKLSSSSLPNPEAETTQDYLEFPTVTWKGTEFRYGDRIKLKSRAGTFKPKDTGHSVEINAGPGQTGTILGGVERQGTLGYNASEPIQVVIVRWDKQVWEEWSAKEPQKTVSLNEFKASVHCDYLKPISKK